MFVPHFATTSTLTKFRLRWGRQSSGRHPGMDPERTTCRIARRRGTEQNCGGAPAKGGIICRAECKEVSVGRWGISTKRLWGHCQHSWPFGGTIGHCHESIAETNLYFESFAFLAPIMWQNCLGTEDWIPDFLFVLSRWKLWYQHPQRFFEPDANRAASRILCD